MSVVVFTGPTLLGEEGKAELAAAFFPPASQGDVYLAVKGGARVIGIIDGYFERIPAVWHKEILWAMAQGVHVYGSASMGALRAAELTAFGRGCLAHFKVPTQFEFISELPKTATGKIQKYVLRRGAAAISAQ